MSDPLAILQDPATQEAIKHFGDSFLDKFGGRLGGRAATFIWGRFVRTLKRDHVEERGLALRVQRLESSIMGLSDALSEGGFVFVEAELDEPSAEAFAESAINDAVASPSEGKRRILGRMIAHRLVAKTEGVYELFLRDARLEVASLNEDQLVLLATLMALSYTPVPYGGTDDQLRAFVADRVVPVLAELAKIDPSRSDTEKLLADDVLIEMDEGLAEHSKHVDVPRLRLAPFGISRGSDVAERMIDVAQQFRQDILPRGSPTRGTGLGSLWLTPKGAVIAALVLEAHFKERIYFPEWEGGADKYPACFLMAPFSSLEWDQYSLSRDVVMRDQLKRTIEKIAPEIVGKEIQKGLRRGHYS